MARTQNMDRWTIELQLHMTKESKRFKSAKMFHRYKETILEILERENPDQQQGADGQQQRDNSLHMNKINDHLDLIRLNDFLGRIADNCSTVGETSLLERSLRECLLQARRKSCQLGNSQTALENDPMCYFCASHLDHLSTTRVTSDNQQQVGEPSAQPEVVSALVLPQIQFLPQRGHENNGTNPSQQSNAAADDTPPSSSGAPSPDIELNGLNNSHHHQPNVNLNQEELPRPGVPQAESEQHYKRAFYYQPQPFRSTTPPLPEDPTARAAFLAASLLPSSVTSELGALTVDGNGNANDEQPPMKLLRSKYNGKNTNASNQQQQELDRAKRQSGRDRMKRQFVALGESSLRVEGEEELTGRLVIAESPLDTHEDSMEEFFQELNERPPSRHLPPLASTPLQEEKKKKKGLGAVVASLVAAGVERKPSSMGVEFQRASRMSASLQPVPAPLYYSQPSASQSINRASGSQLKRKRTAKKRTGSNAVKAASQSHLDTSFANCQGYGFN